jgi:hypothetical protein
MILSMQRRTAFAGSQATATCADCGTPAGGNFCSSCGADLRADAPSILGSARRTFPVVYLQLLRSPILRTVALAEDKTYREHLSFLLTAIGIFCLLFLPTLFAAAAAAGPEAHVSEGMQTLMKVLSQAGVYVGATITFLLAFGLFRYFSREPRSLQAYFKLYCLAFGLVMPMYAAYEFITRHMLGVTGMSSLNGPMTAAQWATPSTILAVVLALLLWSYFIAIHRRFWRLPLWKAGVLYVVAATASYQLTFWLMYAVGYGVAKALITSGVLQT